MHENKLRIAFIAIAILLALSGCRSRREIAAVTGAARETADFFAAWQKRYPPVRTFAARTNMEIRLPGSEMKSRVDLKILADSVMQLSVQPMAGIEVIRVEFTQDSVKMLDRLNRQYLIESYATLNQTSPVPFNYYDLQALLLNRIFSPGEKYIAPEQYAGFIMQHREGLAQLQTSGANGMACSFTADAEEKLLATGITHDETPYRLLCRYSEFSPDNSPAFPMHINMEIDNGPRRALDLSISFSKIQRDASLSLDFPISKNYKQVNFTELLKSLNLK